MGQKTLDGDAEMVTRLRGYDFFRAIGSPQRIVAPMVGPTPAVQVDFCAHNQAR